MNQYDLLLEPGPDLSRVAVHVAGARGLTIADDGSLLIDTAVGPVTQPVPLTWQVAQDGSRREVACRFTLIGRDRFGFVANGWDRETSLCIDPGLIWSTFLGGSGHDVANGVHVAADGIVTVVGQTDSSDFPSTIGSYDTTYNGSLDVFLCQFDPSKTGNAQLVYSTFLGGTGYDGDLTMAVGERSRRAWCRLVWKSAAPIVVAARLIERAVSSFGFFVGRSNAPRSPQSRENEYRHGQIPWRRNAPLVLLVSGDGKPNGLPIVLKSVTIGFPR